MRKIIGLQLIKQSVVDIIVENNHEMAASKDKAMRLASTVILLAPSQRKLPTDSDYKVLMMKRAKTMKFMPGVHVFPGGAIDEIDRDPRWTTILGSDTPSSLLVERLGAVRETFEEAGILLANPQQTVSKIAKDELAHWRKEVLKDGSNFLKMFEMYNLRPAVNSLIPWSVWITPPFESRRFYTHFFLATVPALPTESKLHETNENVTTDWLRPEKALELYKSGQLKFIPPQFYTMTELSECRDLARVADMRRNHTIVPIQPEFQEDDGYTISALPGDPLHPSGAKQPHHRHRILFGGRGEGLGSNNMTLVKDLSDKATTSAKL